MKLPPLSADKLAQLIGVASDIALVITHQGNVQSVSVGWDELAVLGCSDWIGRPWADTVTSESRIKITDMLASPSNGQRGRWRQVNHPSSQGREIPLEYTVLQINDKLLLALGRGMEAVASLQQRLIESQQKLERDYQRLRHMEGKSRILFETATEPSFTVDGATQRVLELNPSAQALLGQGTKRLQDRDVLECFEPASHDEVLSLLRMAQATGRVEMGRARVLDHDKEVTLSAKAFPSDQGAQVLLRCLGQESRPHQDPQESDRAWMQEALERAPDGWILADRQGVILSANAEFLSQMGAISLAQLQGQPLERWLERGSVDWGVLQTNVRQLGYVRNFATELKTFSGLNLAVEITALTLSDPQANWMLYVHDIHRLRQANSPAKAAGMADSVAQLAQLVGRMPMKDIVGETNEMIERMCILAALDLTRNNRASAAEMLGLSRQSLYVKLRRFGLATDKDH
ncbi:MAG: transcriptional regulator PpsR [Limnohabitans sp.]